LKGKKLRGGNTRSSDAYDHKEKKKKKNKPCPSLGRDVKGGSKRREKKKGGRKVAWIL